MKLVFISSIISVISASSFLEDAFEYAKNKTSTQPNAHARNFGHAVNNQGSNIFSKDYGCWCLFSSNNGYVGSGNGEAVDEMDAECKLLHDNYNCMVVEEASCDVYNVVYNRPGGAWTTTWADQLWSGTVTPEDIVTECNKVNNPLCERSACIIESTFLNKYYALETRRLAGDGSILRSQNYHENGFNNAQCNMGNSFTSWSSNRGDKRCCGQYETYKQIYFTGTKGCCNNQNVYNHQTKKCCMNGNVRDMTASCN